MNRRVELERELYKLECAGYPGSESWEFKRACERMRNIEEELKTLEAADEEINKSTTIKKQKQEKSWTRKQYEAAYRLYRRFGEYWENGFIAPEFQDVWKAADYSYQALDYAVSGWINDRRYNRFMVIKWRILTRREVYPF